MPGTVTLLFTIVGSTELLGRLEGGLGDMLSGTVPSSIEDDRLTVAFSSAAMVLFNRADKPAIATRWPPRAATPHSRRGAASAAVSAAGIGRRRHDQGNQRSTASPAVTGALRLSARLTVTGLERLLNAAPDCCPRFENRTS